MNSRHRTCALKRPVHASFASVVHSLSMSGSAADSALVRVVEVDKVERA